MTKENYKELARLQREVIVIYAKIINSQTQQIKDISKLFVSIQNTIDTLPHINSSYNELQKILSQSQQILKVCDNAEKVIKEEELKIAEENKAHALESAKKEGEPAKQEDEKAVEKPVASVVPIKKPIEEKPVNNPEKK